MFPPIDPPRRIRFGRYFVRLFVNSILLVVFPIIILGYVSYGISARMIQQKVTALHLQSLEHTKRVLDERLRALKYLLYHSSENAFVDYLRHAYQPLSGMDLFRVLKLTEILQRAKQADELIDEIFVYFRALDIVVDANLKYETSEFLNRHYVFSDYPESERRFLLGEPRTMAIEVTGPVMYEDPYGQTTHEILDNSVCVVRSLPIGAQSPAMVFVMVLNAERIYSLLSSRQLVPNTSFLVLRGDGARVRTSRNAGSTIDDDDASIIFDGIRRTSRPIGSLVVNLQGQSHTVMFANLEETDWVLVTLERTEVIISDANRIKFAALQFGLAALLAGAVLSLVVSNRMYRPIDAMLSRMDASSLGSVATPRFRRLDELAVISTQFLAAVADRMRFRETIRRYVPVVQERFLYHLAKGRYPSAELIHTQATDLGVPLSADRFVACVVEIDHFFDRMESDRDSGMQYLPMVIGDYAVQVLKGRFAFVAPFCDEHSIGIFICSDSREDEEAVGLTTECAAVVQGLVGSDRHLSLSFGIGTPKGRIVDFAVSYAEARSALARKFFLGLNRIIRFDDSYTQTAEAPVAKDREYIVNTLRGGDSEQLCRRIDALVDGALRDGYPPAQSIKTVYLDTLLIAVGELEAVEGRSERAESIRARSLQGMKSAETLQETREHASGCLREIAEALSSLCRDHHHRMFDIEEYLKSNFHREVTLSSVAQEFELSPAYLSTCFRRATGTNFLRMLMQIRVEKAKEMLCAADRKKIAVIAEETGFGSYKSFVRTFKKRCGIAPEDYRRSHA